MEASVTDAVVSYQVNGWLLRYRGKPKGAMMGDVRLASTVMLLRDGASGIEVFMVQRHRRSGFLPQAWVFPGGRVDDRDDVADHPRFTGGGRLAERFGVSRRQAVAVAVAGIRETFEEAGVWLGTGALPAELRKPLNAGERTLGDVVEAHAVQVDLDQMVAWSWWVTPKAEPKRYDTRFLAVRAVGHEHARHDEEEVVDSRWVSPRAVIAADDQAAFQLAPPTWWTLVELARHRTVDEVLAQERPQAAVAIQPLMDFGDRGVRLVLPGHPEHGEPAVDGVPDLITFEQSWVPWRAEQRMAVLDE